MDVKNVPETMSSQTNITPNIEYYQIEIPFQLFQYLNSDDCNLDSICRICLSHYNETMYPQTLDKSENIISRVYGSIITEDPIVDGLPAHICESCQKLLLQYNEFKTKCEKSYEILKAVLLGDHTLEQDKVEVKLQNKNGKQSVINSSQEIIKNEVKDETENYEGTIEYIEDLSDNEKLSAIVGKENLNQKSHELSEDVCDSKAVVKESKIKSKKKLKSHFKCHICSKSFLKLKNYHNHFKKHDQVAQLPYACKHCRETYSSEHDLNLHLSLHTKGPSWKCSKCQKEFNSRTQLRRHMDRHMESKRYSCESCGKPFAELYALRRHSRVHTGEVVEKKYKCHLCDKRYSSSSMLSCHMHRHSGVRPCACSECDKTFPTARLLASHRRVHSDLKPHACLYCHKRFRHESSRNTHHRTHTGEKPFVCTLCAKTFIQSSNLRQHMRTHTGEKPHTCKVCSKSFSSSSTLKTHERVHTGERPYQCNVCGKRFSRKNLRAHMSTHTGERPHECSACHKRFVSLTRLKEHARTHTGEKPFSCTNCHQAFASKSHLARHVKSSHNKDKVKPKMSKSRKTKLLNKLIRETVCDENICTEEIQKGNDTECKTIMFETEEEPIEVGGELVLEDDSNMKTEVLVFDNSQNFQTANVLNSNEIIVSDVNYANNLVAVGNTEGEGTMVKLYQLDQSLLQIHSTGGQVTISKITSKMTANF